MIQKETLKYLSDLKHNNNKPWFEKNRSRFEDARSDFGKLVSHLITQLGKTDPDISVLETKDCIFRQNRDIRFSKDKTPYKISMGAYLNKGGKRINTAGYYIHIEPGKSMVAGGLYQPEAKQLARVRQEIDYNLEEWEKILKSASFRKNFSSGPDTSEKLSRPPKGYDEANPAIEYLKLKSFNAFRLLTDKEIMDKDVNKVILNACISIRPMVQFLNRAAD